MIDPGQIKHITPEDMERLRKAAAAMSTAVSDAFAAVAEAISCLCDSLGMDYQETAEHIRALFEAAGTAEELRSLQPRPKHKRPPWRPTAAMTTYKPTARRPQPRARSTVRNRRNRKRA